MMFSTNEKAGLTREQLRLETQREKLSDYLPYLFADKNNKYLCMDNTEGYIWECQPLAFSAPFVQKLETLFKASMLEKTVIQFILYADPNIAPIVSKYRANKISNDPLTAASVDQYAKHLETGARGVKSMFGIPLRNFRVFACMKNEKEIDENSISIVEECLRAARLAPVRMQPSALLSFLRNLFNDPYGNSNGVYDAKIPLRKQIILANTEQDFRKSPAKIGNCFFKCLTPKVPFGTITSVSANKLIGGYEGLSDDLNQIACPFLLSMNIIVDNINYRSEIQSKATMTLMQKAGGSLAKKLGKRIAEFTNAIDKIESGENYYKVITTFILFSENEDTLNEMAAKAKRIWNEFDCQLQEETKLLKILFLSSLPLGFYHVDDNLLNIDRHFYMTGKEITRLLPVQADFKTQCNPVMLFPTRKGNLVPLDLFTKATKNYNFCVSASSGSGKTFSLNNLCNSYHSAGAAIRIVDLGAGYKKSCKLAKGRYIDYQGEKVVSNPFDFFGDEEDITLGMVTCRNILAEMVYSLSGAQMTEVEWSLLSAAIDDVHAKGNHEAGVDSVIHYLKRFPKDYPLAEGELATDLDFAISTARKMAMCLFEFGRKGKYGNYFNGKSTFDISNDQFVVLELESLKNNSELLGVVSMQMMNSVTQDLYLSKRGEKTRFILFEEAATILKEQGHKDLSRFAKMIEEGYRRARKYQGSFGVVLQSILDTLDFGPVGQVILSNASFKFYLESPDYAKASELKVIPYEGVQLQILQSVKNNNPYYSEMFIDSPLGCGVVRVNVDKWTHAVNTSDPQDMHAYESLIEQGFSNVEALSKISGVKL